MKQIKLFEKGRYNSNFNIEEAVNNWLVNNKNKEIKEIIIFNHDEYNYFGAMIVYEIDELEHVPEYFVTEREIIYENWINHLKSEIVEYMGHISRIETEIEFRKNILDTIKSVENKEVEDVKKQNIDNNYKKIQELEGVILAKSNQIKYNENLIETIEHKFTNDVELTRKRQDYIFKKLCKEAVVDLKSKWELHEYGVTNIKYIKSNGILMSFGEKQYSLKFNDIRNLIEKKQSDISKQDIEKMIKKKVNSIYKKLR